MRFPEFADEWKQTTLGEIGTYIRGLTYNSDDVQGSGYIVVRANNITEGKAINFDTELVQVRVVPSTQQMLMVNDIAICMANGSSHLVGKASYYNGNASGVCTVGAFCGIFRSTNPLTRWFFQTSIYNRYIYQSIQGGDGAIANLKGEDILKQIYSLPSSLAEQEKIAGFLSLIDERIESCSETIKERKREKAALLNQLFSQKLRFPDFDDEWRVTTLGTILSLAPQIPIDKPCIKDIISVKLHGKGISRTSATTLNLGATQYYLRRVGQLIYGKQNFHNGAIALIPKEYDNGITSKDIPSFVFDTTKSSPKYVLAYLLRTKYYEATEVYTTGTGSKRLKEDSFFSLPISLPSLEEQKKIADFLSLIDERIEVEEQLLQQYEKQKRYLLRQMFV
ncbi:hypothetical protein CLI72_09040 [Porphyromonas gingivalis]|uniref:restriction endonuclease subunit S n=1 Tax=Porphyromonas gingivalis TaxID=837 RepID=UPI000BE70026|nr:restriction endonuclease subunit S [Porphyromonas gingivalis]PDP80446.1 hypothetical protein CLI72_09040 [Porphyromonas gingivalis]